MGFSVAGGMIPDPDGGWEELENWSRPLELSLFRMVNREVEADRSILAPLILVDPDDPVNAEVNLMSKVSWASGISSSLTVTVNTCEQNKFYIF